MIEGFGGVTAREANVAGETVSVAKALSGPEMAVIVVVPALSAVTTPELLTEATAAAETVHATLPVKSTVLPSPRFPVTEIC